MIALIEGQSENAFLVALPDGEYTVWLIACDAEWDPPLFEVWANNQKKLDVRIPRAAFVYMEPFQVRATGGRLQIELKGRHGWILNGLVIGKEGPELAEVVAKLTQDIFFLTDRELPKWKEVKDTPVNPPLELTPQEVERGYVVFPADYTEPIVPAYVPARAVIGKPLAAFATPGEFEPATLCVSAQKDLGSVAVEVSDFVAEEGGHTISAKSVDVGVVRCWPVRDANVCQWFLQSQQGPSRRAAGPSILVHRQWNVLRAQCAFLTRTDRLRIPSLGLGRRCRLGLRLPRR